MGKPQTGKQTGKPQRNCPSGRPPQDGARKGALRLLAGVRDGMALSDQSGAIAGLAPAERARAQRLALAVLRNIDRADTLLVRHLSKKPRPDVLDALRLGTVELLEMGEAPHGAVNAAVGLVQGMGPKGRAASGMVNAVLRKIAGQGAEWASLPPEEMPDWLRDPIAAAWGQDVVLAIEAAHQAGAPVEFSARPGKEAPGAALPGGSYRLHDWRRSAPCRVLPRATGGCRMPLRPWRRGCWAQSPANMSSIFARRRGARRCNSPLPGRG